MSNFYAQISSNVVVGVSQVKDTINASSMIPIASLTAVSPGDIYDPDTGTFSTPAPVATPKMRLSRGEFRDQFTMDEQRAIYSAEATSVDVRIYLDDLRSREHVDLDNPKTIANVGALEAMGLIATGRATEILAGVTD